MTDLIQPVHYTEEGLLFPEEGWSGWRFLLWANLLALIPLGVAALLLWLPYQFYLALGAPLAVWGDPAWSAPGYALAALVIGAGSLLLHEGLHGVGLLLRGHGVRFGWQAGYLYATSAPDRYLSRADYLLMTLLPLTSMTTGGALLLPLLPPALGQIVLAALLLNAAASIGDLAVARRVWRCPADTHFADRDGIRLFRQHSRDS
jgi:hypothetical protein